MTGWTGKILTIDLSARKAGVIKPPQSLYETFLGGKGLAGHYLLPDCTRNWNDPAMPLLFFTGPLVDTPAPTSGRMTVMSRSPLTGAIGDTSVGGKLGTQLKRAGWDGIVITGKSERTCGVRVHNDSVRIDDAGEFAGLEVSQVIERLSTNGSVACVGPAAENGVLFANIMIDGHFAAGRTGLGAVMAAKGMKFLVVEGNGKTAVHDPGELALAREEIFRLVASSPVLKGELGISEFGTGALYDLMHSRRMMPTDNFRATRFEEAPGLNAWHFRERYRPKKSGCAGCHILCKKKNGAGVPLPEFETMSHFTALLGNTDLDMVVEANRLCNEYGMDTITAAVTLACHAEIENTRLEPAAIIALLGEIARGSGGGAALGQGSRRYAALRGRPGSAITVKGLELAAYDPRGAYGMALAYATSTRGACHLRAYPIAHEILRKPVATDRFSFSGKARIIKLTEDSNAVVDSLTACRFIFFAATLEEYARALYGATGMRTSAQELLRTGDRIYYQERIMNARNGFSILDDDLPERFFTEPGTGGDGIAIPPLDRGEFERSRAAYYRIRGLDRNGMPTRETCEKLGLPWND